MSKSIRQFAGALIAGNNNFRIIVAKKCIITHQCAVSAGSWGSCVIAAIYSLIISRNELCLPRRYITCKSTIEAIKAMTSLFCRI